MSQPGENHASKMVASSASGTTFLIMIQLTSRLFTFGANQLVLRNLSPAILGIATQLELFLVSILYFSRESIRIAIQRQPLDQPLDLPSMDLTSDEKGSATARRTIEAQSMATQSVVNVSYLSLGTGIPLAIAFATFYIHLASEEVSGTPFYYESVTLTCIASLLELSTEPFFAVVQQHMMYKKRAAVEMTAAFAKSVAICSVFAWAAWNGYNVGVLPFALGYLCYSLALICGYSLAILKTASECQFSFRLTRIRSSDKSVYIADRFSLRLVSLSANVFFQSVIKHLLTQGDAMMLAAMSSLEDQGIYSLASNYGGLIARILFQPIEESSRNLFSSLLSSSEAGKETASNIGAAKAHLINILKAYAILAALVFPLGPSLVPRLLHLLGGTKWASSEVDSLLSLYCYYIPFLAFNGITEAFVSSAASPSELREQAGWMGAFSACFALAAYLFLRIGGLGAHGLVYANLVNMAVRILWSFSFVRYYLQRYRNDLALTEFGLRPATCIAGILTTSIVLASPGYFDTSFSGTMQAFSLGAAYAIFILYLEREYLRTLYIMARQLLKTKTSGHKTE